MTSPASKSPLRVHDAVTPPQYSAHVGTKRTYLDTGAGFFVSEGKWLPSWWKDGWTGPRHAIDFDALKYTISQLPEAATWILNIEHWPYDIRSATNSTVEKHVDQLRDILRCVREHRRGITRGFYAPIPPEHFDITMYHKAKQVQASVGNGVSIEGSGWWIANLPKFEVRYKAWINAVNRLTYGFDATGKLDTGGGLIDELDILNPKTYLVGDLADGAFDALDIESDKYAITEHVEQAKRVSDGRLVLPMMSPYIEQTNDKPKPHRQKISMKVARDAGADGCVMWHYTGGKMPNEWECKVMDMAANVFQPKAAA